MGFSSPSFKYQGVKTSFKAWPRPPYLTVGVYFHGRLGIFLPLVKDHVCFDVLLNPPAATPLLSLE